MIRPTAALICYAIINILPRVALAFTTPSRRRSIVAAAVVPSSLSLRLQASIKNSSSSSSSLLRNSSTNDDDDGNNMTSSQIIVPHLSPNTLANLVEYTISFSAANGLQVEVAPPSSDNPTTNNKKTYITAPISLLPQSYPLAQFTHGIKLSSPFNVLVDRISRHGQFLQHTLEDVRNVDEFTGMLLKLYEDIYLNDNDNNDDGSGKKKNEGAKSADRLGILRSDYMLHRSDSGSGGEYSLKQVELNTIASSFAGLASTVAKLHKFLTKRMEDDGDELYKFLEENEHAVMGSVGDSRDTVEEVDKEGIVTRGVPTSLAMIRLPAAMAVTYERYRARFNIDNNKETTGGSSSSSSRKLVILFVVQPNETNTVDQRLLEFALWENHKIPVVRMSLGEIYKRVRLDEMSGRLTIDSDCDNNSGNGVVQEVAVVYFRAGYAPTDYPSGYNTEDGSGIEWLARERLERGCAAKCPNLGYHLAGTKKVQQELARRGAVEQFFTDDEADVAAQIRTAFAGLYSLGADANEEDMKAVKDVLFNNAQGQYVLKPQREGGGYNYYGENLANKLAENCTISGGDDDSNKEVTLSSTLSEFILMERLFPPQQRAILLRNGHVEGTGMSISELGCFGAIVTSGDGEVIHNEYAGFLLRTKFSGVDEGGVASGFATLSSPYLC